MLVLSGSFLLASLIRFGEQSPGDSWDWVLVLIPLYVVVGFYGRLYTLDSMKSLRKSTQRAIFALMSTMAIILFAFFVIKYTDNVSRTMFFLGGAMSFPLLMLVRIPVFLFVDRVIGDRFVRKLFIVDGVGLRQMAGYEVVDCTELGLKLDLNDPVILHALSMTIMEYDRVLVDCRIDHREQWSLFLQAAGCIGNLLIPELQSVVSDHSKLDLEAASIRVSTGPLDLRSRMVKRVFDLTISCLLCFALAPLFIVIAIAIKIDSKGPVLFKQLRMGRGNRLFYVFKFRSMRNEATDMNGVQSASRDDHRITRVGRIIRATSVDELPQLFNVLRGEMSLVGPRPHALGSKAGNDLFWHVDVRYWLRHSTKPGITGLAQVRGFRGATDTHRDLTERLRYDLEYLRNWSILRDIGILLATAGVVVHKKAY
ncbi:sugar transferase [Sphingobium limneticum]|nr:sugar transferase [Sphingobium limneticum]